MARRGRAFVINMDEVGGPGTHWTAARLIRWESGSTTLYYADPLGTVLSGFPPRELEGIANETIINNITFQRPDTNLCGYWSYLIGVAIDLIDTRLSREQFVDYLFRYLTTKS